MPGTRDVIDWPQPSRDGYVINNVSTIITAYAYGGMHAMKVLPDSTLLCCFFILRSIYRLLPAP